MLRNVGVQLLESVFYCKEYNVRFPHSSFSWMISRSCNDVE